MKHIAKKEMIEKLRERIRAMEGFKGKAMDIEHADVGLEAISTAFPYKTFPIGAVHEFVSLTAASATAANGFISGILSTLMEEGMHCLWISTGRSLFPLALNMFGLAPHQVIFVDVRSDTHALWVMEQGLKCDALIAVVAELGEISFAESQRLQLAVEKSRVTGFLHRRRPRRQHALACVTRWQIKPLPSQPPDVHLPGVSHPVWEVQLEKVRNGKPGKWCFTWRNGNFVYIPSKPVEQSVIEQSKRYG